MFKKKVHPKGCVKKDSIFYRQWVIQLPKPPIKVHVINTNGTETIKKNSTR